MVMRTLISKVATCNKLLFVCPPVCSYPPLSYLKGLLLVQAFFLFTACCDYVLPLLPSDFSFYAPFSFAPSPCFLSFLSLFPFASIPISYRCYPLFPFAPISVSFRSYPLFPSLLFALFCFVVVLACPLSEISSAYIKRFRCRVLAFVVLFAL